MEFEELYRDSHAAPRTSRLPELSVRKIQDGSVMPDLETRSPLTAGGTKVTGRRWRIAAQAERAAQFRGVGRAAQVRSLTGVSAHGRESVDLGLGLDALPGERQLQEVGERGHRVHVPGVDGVGLSAAPQFAEEGPVELEHGEREASQIGQVGV